MSESRIGKHSTPWTIRGSLWRILCACLLVFMLMAGGAGTQTAAAATGAARVAKSPSASTGELVVIMKYGAALRVSPSSNSRIVYVVPCGTVLDKLDTSAGWYYVGTASNLEGWVGGARVASYDNPPAYSCKGARTFQMLSRVRTKVASGCLSLRAQPSRQSSYAHCVSNGHLYTVTNGPIAVAGEDWIGLYSASTGYGWSLAQYLYPA